jgi:hypothetical protein
LAEGNLVSAGAPEHNVKCGQMALAGTPARYNKSFSVIRQYSPTFATAHGGIQYDCGGGFPKPIYLFGFIYVQLIH